LETPAVPEKVARVNHLEKQKHSLLPPAKSKGSTGMAMALALTALNKPWVTWGSRLCELFSLPPEENA